MSQIQRPGNFLLARIALSLTFTAACAALARAQTAPGVPTLEIQAGRIAGHVSPTLYGLMTEEINYSYEGGLYGELIRNRSFKANRTRPVYWSTVGNATISLDTNQPLNQALNVSLKLEAAPEGRTPAGIANGGYWGIPVKPDTTYHASFYSRAANGFAGHLSIALVSDDGDTTFASATVGPLSADWKEYEATLTTKRVEPSAGNRLVITTTSPGTVWFSQVSLFPPTFNNRPNGNRPDLMRILAGMHPKFLRFPGGNYLEGNSIASRFDWKKTVGPISQRPGHESPWGYWSTDGLGLLEFLEWCEDLRMQPVLAVYAGYSLNGQHISPGPDLEPYIQSALEEIEYVVGGPHTAWGARRVRDGHPAPFPLRYVEVGNEDEFDRSGSYNGRFKQFYNAIKEQYPRLQVIATTPVTSCTPDLIDEHYYLSAEAMEAGGHRYDNHPRTGPKVFVGEWAAHETSFPPWDRRSAALPPTPDMKAALGDAAWMTGLERNSDLIVMECYAPLLVNVNPGARQWRPDLIGYNALTCYGSPSYYAQAMFGAHHGDEILATQAENIPTRPWRRGGRRNGEGQSHRPRQQLDQLFFDATRDSHTGTIYLKIVNCLGTPQPVKVEIHGASVGSHGREVFLKAKSLDDTNSIDQPRNIVPVSQEVDGLGAEFTRTLPAYSISVLALKAESLQRSERRGK